MQTYCLVESLRSLSQLEIHVATDSATHPRFREILPAERCHKILDAKPKKGMLSILESTLKLNRLLKVLEPDVLHCPAGQLPFIPFVKCSQVSTIADLNFKSNYEYSLIQRIYKDISYRWTLFRADGIAAVSKFTSDQIVRYYGYPSEKISVVHHAAIQRYACSDASQEFSSMVPFFLAFGHHSHKNCEAAVKAIRLLKDIGDGTFRLAVVGKNSYVEDRLRTLVVQQGVQDQVFFVGYVSDAQLGALYDAAEGLLFLSRFEGFGLPLVEAFAAKCPVIAATTCSIPEVVDDAGLLCDPDDIEGIAEAMRSVRHDELLKAALVARGLHRLKSFCWHKAALRTAEVYQKSLGRLPTN